jgi:hypothetical protein
MRFVSITAHTNSSRGLVVLIVAIVLPLIAILSGCNLDLGGSGLSASEQETQNALNVQLTLIALQADQGAQQTTEAQLATSIAQSVQATDLAQQATSLAEQATQIAGAEEQPTQLPPEEPTTAPPTEPPATQPLPSPTPTQDVEQLMRSANILLFEDMAGDFNTTRYIKQTLDSMGLPYTDVKDAAGRYKEHLLSGGPGGQPWDLIISAAESRTGIQGEFFEYLNDALNRGSSVIIEVYNLDEIGLGKVAVLLSRCGVEFQADWWDEPLNEQVLYPLDPTHPVLFTPNSNVSLTNPTGYWLLELGDLLRTTPGSEATLLLGTRATQKTSYGVSVSCLQGRMIIQTFGTHNYGRDRVTRLWENYIYNTLVARFTISP